MSRLMATSDLHLGHKNIHKFRMQFDTAIDHHEFVFDRLVSNINKSDSIVFLGDICFDEFWLKKIATINCRKKTLILGNHDTDRLSIFDIVNSGAYDAIHSLWSKRNAWFTHCPIHPDQFRGKTLNIHGHLHDKKVEAKNVINGDMRPDLRYFNVCVEHTDYKPVSFFDITRNL